MPKTPTAPQAQRPLRVAIVHDWLIGGGAERVVEELHSMFPDAPIYTSYCTPEWHERLDGKVVTGFLQRWPFSKLRKYMGVLRIWWFGHINFNGYDLIISSTGNGEAFGITKPQAATHICYCHTPTHYYWRHYDTYMKRPGFGIFDPLARLGLRLLVWPLRTWDLRASKRPDYFIANSTHIQHDIKTYYNRESVVIHPPIDISRFTGKSEKRKGFVTVGRQAPHKHTEIIVEACTKLNVPLTVVGRGPEHARLKKIAGPSITFAPPASDKEVAQYVRSAKAFIFASFDDFGITPIEAMAAGTPVIAFRAGGALDYIEDQKTGLFFDEQTAESLAKTLARFDAIPFDAVYIQTVSQQFSPQVFQNKLTKFINQIV